MVSLKIHCCPFCGQPLTVDGTVDMILSPQFYLGIHAERKRENGYETLIKYDGKACEGCFEASADTLRSFVEHISSRHIDGRAALYHIPALWRDQRPPERHRAPMVRTLPAIRDVEAKPRRPVTIRLDCDMVDHLRATHGKAYGRKINAVLREFLNHEKER